MGKSLVLSINIFILSIILTMTEHLHRIRKHWTDLSYFCSTLQNTLLQLTSFPPGFAGSSCIFDWQPCGCLWWKEVLQQWPWDTLQTNSQEASPHQRAPSFLLSSPTQWLDSITNFITLFIHFSLMSLQNN